MNIGKVLHKWRVSSEIPLRDFCKEIKLDHSTLWRLENGKEPSAETMRKVLLWLIR